MWDNMRIKIKTEAASILVPIVEYTAQLYDSSILPARVSGPFKSRRCLALPDSQLLLKYDITLPYWYLNNSQNLAVFTQVFYTDNIKEAIESLRWYINNTYEPLWKNYGGTFNLYDLSPQLLGDFSNSRYGIRLEYSLSLLSCITDPNMIKLFSIRGQYPSILYADLLEKIKLASTTPLESVFNIAEELVVRAAGVYTDQKNLKYYKDTYVSLEECNYFLSPDISLKIQQDILKKACNRLIWFITSNNSEEDTARTFNATYNNSISFADEDHEYFTGIPQQAPDFYITDHDYIKIEYKTRSSWDELLAGFKELFDSKLSKSSVQDFNEQTDLISNFEHFKWSKEIPDFHGTRYHKPKVCIVALRDTGERFWIYYDINNNLVIKYLFTIK